MFEVERVHTAAEARVLVRGGFDLESGARAQDELVLAVREGGEPELVLRLTEVVDRLTIEPPPG